MTALVMLAALWGFAEATVFFVVPDVLLSVVALRRGAKPALLAAVVTALAAAAGGAIMWLVARGDALIVPSLLDVLPGISKAMIAEVGATMRGPDWIQHMLAGAFSGVPYKIFAAEAGIVGIGLPGFVAVSVPVRLTRFVGVIALTLLYRRMANASLGAGWSLRLLLAFWILFYAAFWSLMPS